MAIRQSRANRGNLPNMAGFDAAERELDAAFGRFEGLMERLQGWRRAEAEAERRAQAAEADALRVVEETEAAAERAVTEAGSAREERDAALAERDRVAAEFASRAAAAHGRGRIVAREAGAADRRVRHSACRRRSGRVSSSVRRWTRPASKRARSRSRRSASNSRRHSSPALGRTWSARPCCSRARASA